VNSGILDKRRQYQIGKALRRAREYHMNEYDDPIEVVVVRLFEQVLYLDNTASYPLFTFSLYMS